MTPDKRMGLLAALSAYVMWGLLPLYFKTVQSVSPDAVLAHRVAWSLPTGLLLVIVAGRYRDIATVLSNRCNFQLLLLSGALIGFNWLIYIWAVNNEKVMEASLGYYINPLFNFLFGALLFGERFSKLQFVAIALAALGVLNQTLNVGSFPWIAMSLCLTFAVYSIIRKYVEVDGRVGFVIEVLLLAPFAIAYLVYLWSRGAPFLAEDVSVSVWIALSGIITAAPLIFFSIAARRLRLSTIGILQYIGPSLQFALALYFGEPFKAAHAITFGLIWVGMGLFSYSLWRQDVQARAKPVPVEVQKKSPASMEDVRG